MKKLVSILALVLLAAPACSDSPTSVTESSSGPGRVSLAGVVTNSITGEDETVRLVIEYDSFQRWEELTNSRDVIYTMTTGQTHVTTSSETPYMQEVASALDVNAMDMVYNVREGSRTRVSGTMSGTSEAGEIFRLNWSAAAEPTGFSLANGFLADVSATTAYGAILRFSGPQDQSIYEGRNLALHVHDTGRLIGDN